MPQIIGIYSPDLSIKDGKLLTPPQPLPDEPLNSVGINRCGEGQEF